MSTRPNTMRRWSLPLAVVMLLHWTFGACAALADTLCIEPDGRVAYEQAGQPCASAVADPHAAKHAVKAGDQHCVDIQLHDGHNDHSPLPAKWQADAQAPALIPAPAWVAPALLPRPTLLPEATGPPVKAFSVIIRETAYLLI